MARRTPEWLPTTGFMENTASAPTTRWESSLRVSTTTSSLLLKPIHGRTLPLGISIATLLIGFVVGRWSKRSDRQQRLISNVEGSTASSSSMRSSAASLLDENQDEETSNYEGVTPVWLNFALSRMWGLFQKNTRRLVNDTMQPVLDETELPDFVKSIQVSRFVPGRQSPLIQSVRRLPSRSLNEVQYAMRGIFSSTSVTDFDVAMEVAGKALTVPVTMENLDVDAKIWVAYSLAPYEPFLTGVKYGLLEPPKVTFEMTVAKLLPITAVPILRKIFFRVITQEVPKDFLLPNTQFLDFTPPDVKEARTRSPTDVPAVATTEELQQLYPEQWALFDALDLDNNDSLSPVELFAGLKDWGYTADDAMDSFELLDVDKNGQISFPEFIARWPSLEASFVPSRYRGEMIGILRHASDIKTSILGGDPVAIMRLNGQEVRTKRDSQTSVVGTRGDPVWMQAFDFKCSDPEHEELEIIIEDGSLLGRGRQLAEATLPIAEYTQRGNQQVKVSLEPEGSLLLDLSYAEFV